MNTYARIDNGNVVEVIKPLVDDEGNEIPIDKRFIPSFVETLVDITNVSPKPDQWWTFDGTEFAPPK
jgi:hypothetical protein